MARLKKREDGRYAKQIYLGKGEDGKRKYKTVYGGSIAEAEELAVTLRLQICKGIDINAAHDTFKTWADRMQKVKKTEGVGRSQQEGIARCCKYLSVLDDLRLSKIQTSDIQHVINQLSDYHDGKPPMSKSTLIKIKGTACNVFRLAIESRVLDFNPAEYVRIPKDAAETHRDAITEVQRQWILETPHRAQTAAIIMLYAGLRRGEVIALTWKDVSLKVGDASITVNKSAELVMNTPEIKTTKTISGMRAVHIPELLRAYLAAQPKASLFVCPNARGGICTKVAWRSLWESYMVEYQKRYGNKKAGLRAPEFTPHQLRHTFCTAMYFAGVDALTARDQMGHADIKTTLSIYTHLDKRHKADSMGKMDAYYASQVQVNESENA